MLQKSVERRPFNIQRKEQGVKYSMRRGGETVVYWSHIWSSSLCQEGDRQTGPPAWIMDLSSNTHTHPHTESFHLAQSVRTARNRGRRWIKRRKKKRSREMYPSLKWNITQSFPYTSETVNQWRYNLIIPITMQRTLAKGQLKLLHQSPMSVHSEVRVKHHPIGSRCCPWRCMFQEN